MGEEWATSAPFLYFADHEDEEMRRSVAEGRKREFSAFGFDGDVPNPEDEKTYEMSKLKWQEQAQEKHAEMLAWVRALIKLRRSTISLNDGDMHRLMVSTNDEHRILVMERDEARVVINFGEQPHSFSLLAGEKLRLISREGISVCEDKLNLPPMTLAVLMSTTEEVENRQVSPHSTRD
jgi:maltooligosyltrehalose trehalohydrolase